MKFLDKNKVFIFSTVGVIFLAILLFLHLFFPPLPYLPDIHYKITLGELISAVILLVGLMIAKAEADNALRPYVDVRVIFEPGERKIRFEFLQISKIPALVWLDIKIKINGRTLETQERKWWLEDPRLYGEVPWKVRLDHRATSFYALKRVANAVMETDTNEAELFITVSVAPVFRENDPVFYEEKHYRFSKSDNNPRWIDQDWGIEDHSFFEKKI